MVDFLVVLLGCTIGVSELLSRYKDSLIATFKAPSTYFYIFLNGGAAYLAFFLMTDAFDWFSCEEPTQCSLGESTQQIFIAGLSGMAVLRASIMSLNVQGTDVGVGPAALIQLFLGIADRGIDRSRAKVRGSIILSLMADVDFNKSASVLPATCFALMQNVTAEEQNLVSDQVTLLESDPGIPDKVKSVLLGLALLPIELEESGLKAGMDLLGDQIK